MITEIKFKHKNIKGIANYNGNIWYGKLLDIDDLVTFQSKHIGKITNEFNNAVDDWIKTRKKLNKK